MYAFTGWVMSGVGFILWLAWAWVPEDAWPAAASPYVPNRYWALAGPAWCTMAFVSTSLLYIAANLIFTAPLDSLCTITDTITNEVDDDGVSIGSGGISGERRPKGRRVVPDIRDVDIVTANRCLYLSSALQTRS